MGAPPTPMKLILPLYRLNWCILNNFKRGWWEGVLLLNSMWYFKRGWWERVLLLNIMWYFKRGWWEGVLLLNIMWYFKRGWWERVLLLNSMWYFKRGWWEGVLILNSMWYFDQHTDDAKWRCTKQNLITKNHFCTFLLWFLKNIYIIIF